MGANSIVEEVLMPSHFPHINIKHTLQTQESEQSPLKQAGLISVEGVG